MSGTRTVSPEVTDEQFEAATIVLARWLHEHPELSSLVIEGRTSTGAKTAIEAAKQAASAGAGQ